MFGFSGFERGRAWDPWRQDEAVGVNVWTGPEGAVVAAELPGLDPSTLEVSVQNQSLSLRGKRPASTLPAGGVWHRRERTSDEFARTIELPFTVEAAKVEARYSRGVLRVMAPRAEADKPRKITVKAQ